MLGGAAAGAVVGAMVGPVGAAGRRFRHPSASRRSQLAIPFCHLSIRSL